MRANLELRASRGESAVRRLPPGYSRRSTALLPAAIDRQRKRKHRAVPELAGHTDGSMLCGDQGLGNWQTHACSAYQIPLVFAAIKFVEDHGLLEVIDSGAAIGDADANDIPHQLRGDGNRLILRGVEVGIVNQLHQRLFGTLAVGI